MVELKQGLIEEAEKKLGSIEERLARAQSQLTEVRRRKDPRLEVLGKGLERKVESLETKRKVWQGVVASLQEQR